MDRAIFYLRIFPGTEGEFDRRHADMWQELVVEIRESGLHNFSAFRRGTDVWCYTEAEPDLASALAIQRSKPTQRRWNHFFRDVVAQVTDDNGELLRYGQVFHSDGPPLDGPYERALFGLVIDPGRAADYEALHADPWPDLMTALEASGYRNYSGFRRGGHVVYYGNFYPDLRTVSARMAAHDVNDRWGAAFKGIITAINDVHGDPLVAKEIYHQP